VGLLSATKCRAAKCATPAAPLKCSQRRTGGIAFFQVTRQVDEIAAEVARDIRSQYTLAYHSTKPSSEPGFRRIQVLAQAKGQSKLNVRTRTG